MLWICAENSVENTEITVFLLSRVYKHQGLFCFSYYPESEGAGGRQETGKGHSWDPWPQIIQRIFHITWHHAQDTRWGTEQGSERSFELWHLTFQVTFACDGALLSWRWLIICLMIGSSKFIPCFSLCMQLLLHTLNCSYLNPWVFLLSLLNSLPDPTEGSELCCSLAASWG